MNYVMVLLVPIYRVDSNVIACEGAFAKHLQELFPRISEWGNRIVIHSPQMDNETYNKNRHHLTHINCDKENVHYIDGPPIELSRTAFLLRSPFSIWPKIWQVVRSANVVHASASKDIFRLFTIVSIVFAVLQHKKTIFVMDIDHRSSAKMSYKTGKFSKKSYLLSQYIYNPLISLQIRFASRFCDLVMLKGKALADDYGKGRAHVKNFYNTAHDLSFVINEQQLSEKLTTLSNDNNSIRLVYFGRIVQYKGIHDMIQATKMVADNLVNSGSKKTVSLTIIGSGIQEAELQAAVIEQGLEELVTFKGAISYGEELFSCLREYDFLLAAPHSEDTPRSVFDAMACGLPMIAYDTYYYKDLESTGTVKTVPWLSPSAMADKIIELSSTPEHVKSMVLACRKFAINNTQKIWMDRRLEWTKEFLSK
ncbi:glycosyltransferase family 4 protein [Eionea flava]